MEGNNFQFKLLSVNVRGIRSFEKRECVFNWLLKQNADIFFLQETYSTKEIENQWRKQWRGELFFSHGTSRSKGVLVLVRENLDFKVKSTYTDDSGRFIFLDTLIQDSPFLLANIYAPTKASEQCQFLDEIAFHIADKVCQSEHYIITGGDFNATFEPNLDCSGGRPSIKNCIKNLNDIMLQNDLVDIWRVRNPDKKRFTWRQKNPLIQRRLDFWLISNSLQDDIENVGLTVEFYKCFWKLMGSLLVNCLNCAYKHGELSSSQKQALIVLIEKKDKDRRQVKNWRPISLTNVDVKIGTKAIAKRLEKVLPEIIHHSQNAYVKGRTIFDAVRTIDDIIKLTSSNNMGSLLVAIDFEKAFDSVNWNFLRHALRKFNFGPSFITWITAFYSNISSCVMNNGFITQPFKLSRGVRQGDPLSPYLFILVLETLAIHIRNDECIKGINVYGHEIKLIIFADDLTIFLKDSASIHCLLAKLELFGQYSGLNVNRGKTEVMKLGTPEISAEELKIDEIKKVVKILGIHFTYDQTLSDKLNFHTIIKSIRKSINSWNWRGLTLLGKIQIIKSFAIPKILYRLSLVSTNKTFVKEVNQVLYNFVWKGKDKVKRLALINSVENGGLNMPHIESLIDTQRIVCIKKYLGDSPCSWKIILDHYLHKVGGSLLFHCNFEYTKLPLDLPDYYRECLATWTKLTASPVSSMDEIVNQILWNNKFICIGQKSVFNRKFFSLGLHKVGDLFNEIYIKPHTTLQNLNAVDFLFLNGLYDCLPPEWKKVMTNDPPSVLIKINHIWDDVFLYSSNDALLLSELSSKKIYNILVSKISISPSAKKKFEDSYASTEQALDWKRIYSNAFRCAIDTKTREFQYKILNRILPLNDFLFKIGKSNSPLCSFCQSSEENMSHFFFHCPLVANFWQSVKHLLGGYELIEREVILGITDTDENVFLKNHLILLGKQHIFRCKHNNSLPSAISFTKTLKQCLILNV